MIRVAKFQNSIQSCELSMGINGNELEISTVEGREHKCSYNMLLINHNELNRTLLTAGLLTPQPPTYNPPRALCIPPLHTQ